MECHIQHPEHIFAACHTEPDTCRSPFNHGAMGQHNPLASAGRPRRKTDERRNTSLRQFNFPDFFLQNTQKKPVQKRLVPFFPVRFRNEKKIQFQFRGHPFPFRFRGAGGERNKRRIQRQNGKARGNIFTGIIRKQPDACKRGHSSLPELNAQGIHSPKQNMVGKLLSAVDHGNPVISADFASNRLVNIHCASFGRADTNEEMNLRTAFGVRLSSR